MLKVLGDVSKMCGQLPDEEDELATTLQKIMKDLKKFNGEREP